MLTHIYNTKTLNLNQKCRKTHHKKFKSQKFYQSQPYIFPKSWTTTILFFIYDVNSIDNKKAEVYGGNHNTLLSRYQR